MNVGAPLPGYALLVSASMRVVDLLDSGLSVDSPQIVASEARPGAGQRLEVMHATLLALDHLATNGRSGFVDMDSLVREVVKSIEGCGAEEVRFVSRFLDVDRECLYVDPRDGQEKGTRSRTRLLTYDQRRDRVKLTEAGRFFLRLGSASHNWLYEDKQAEKILQAIKFEQFDDAAQFAIEHARALRQLSEDINNQIEAPSFDAMTQSYVQQRETINVMLQDAAKSLVLAKASLLTDIVQERLEHYMAIRGDGGISLGRLRGLLNRAHGAMESASRTWAKFLQRVQEGPRRHLGVVDFGLVMDGLLAGTSTDDSIKQALIGVCGWAKAPPFASVMEVIGVMPPKREEIEVPPLVFDSAAVAPEGDAIHSWLERNHEILRSALEQGPQRLSDLIAGGAVPELPIESIEDLSAAFGSFAFADPFGIHDPVVLEMTTSTIEGVADGFRWTAPDLTLSLRGRSEQSQ